jgi:hypothetical protein
MKTFCLILLAACLAAMPSFAQPPDSLWSRTFGGSASDICYSVRQTSDGGYILGGEVGSFGAGNYDFWLVKTNADGIGLWSRTFGGSNQEACRSVLQTPDGGFVLAGSTLSFGAGNRDFWMVKTDANGDSLWSRTFGGSGNDRCFSIQQTSEGGYILAGYTESFGATAGDFYLVKTDASGGPLWTRTFGGSSGEWCYSVRQTPDGGYILAGLTYSFGAGGGDFWLVKTDANGDSLWSRTFGGSDVDECYSLQQTSDGGYILAGVTLSFDVGNGDFWLVKTDADGDSLWSRTFGGIVWEYCHSVQQASDGGYVLLGETWSFGAGAYDCWMVRTNANGDSLWSRTFGGSSLELGYSIEKTPDGGYVLGGGTSSFGSGSHDFWLVKTGPDRRIRVDSPNGGEVWRVLESDTLRWIGAHLGGDVSIDLNRNYPIGEWEVLLSSTANDGEEAFLVTEPPSDHCRVKVTLLGDTLSDISDADFSIVCSQGLLTLVRQAQPTMPMYSWDAGTVDSTETVSETFRLKNFGSEAIIVYQPLEPASAPFSLATDCAATFNLAPGEMSTCEVTLTFDPVTNGTYHDTLLIQSNAINQQGGCVRFPLLGQQITSAVSEIGALPREFALHPNRPNPFNPTTQIAYDLPRASVVSLKVFDVLGREVATLADGVQPAGSHTVLFNGSELASGVYLCRLQAGDFSATQKMVLLK